MTEDLKEFQEYNQSLYSSSFSPFSQNSYKAHKERSNRSFNFDFGSDDEDYDENELVYKILNNSKFELHTDKKGKIPFIIYDKIKLFKNEKEVGIKTIEEIKNATTSNERLLNNYKKFLSFLYKFERELSNEFNNEYKLKITLNIETQNIDYNKNFIITCLYDVEIPGEDNEQYKDENILTNGLGEGFQYMLNEINNSNYSDKKNS